MKGKIGSRKAQAVSGDLIVSVLIYITAFSLFSYYIFAVEGKMLTSRSFIKEGYYSFDTFEENAESAGFMIMSGRYRLNENITKLRTAGTGDIIEYEKLREIIANGTQFETEIGNIDVCMFITDFSGNADFHSGPASEELLVASGVNCGTNLPVAFPFPECSDEYSSGFSSSRTYLYTATGSGRKITIQFCKS